MKYLSALVTIARGKLGGIVGTANSYQSLILRAYVSPANPNTDRQVEIRSAFAEANGVWRNLSPAQREAWDDYAKGTVYSGPTGTYTLTGRLAFVASRSLVVYQEIVGGGSPSQIDDAPSTPGFLNIGSISTLDIVGPSKTGFGVSIGNFTGQDAVALINVSPGFDPTRNSSPGRWDQDLTVSVDLADATTTLFEQEDLVEGLAYFIKIRAAANDVDNRISAVWQGRHIANAVGP